jgi:AcrR family transcriptional regulator
MQDTKWEGIVAEAAKVFARYGYRKTSMDEVAQAAGVAKGTLYLGCESKRDLFYQAILRDLRLWNAELSRCVDPRQPADALLVLVAQQAFDTRDSYPLARDLVLGCYDADLPDWVEHLDELRAASQSTLLELLRLGVRQGRFRGGLDVEAVASVLLDLIATTLMYHTRGPAPEARLQRHAAALFDLVLNGLAAPAAAAGPLADPD